MKSEKRRIELKGKAKKNLNFRAFGRIEKKTLTSTPKFGDFKNFGAKK